MATLEMIRTATVSVDAPAGNMTDSFDVWTGSCVSNSEGGGVDALTALRSAQLFGGSTWIGLRRCEV